MQIHIVDLGGLPHVCEAEPSCTLDDFKSQVREKTNAIRDFYMSLENIDPRDQFYGDLEKVAHRLGVYTIGALGIHEDCTLILTRVQRGRGTVVNTFSEEDTIPPLQNPHTNSSSQHASPSKSGWYFTQENRLYYQDSNGNASWAAYSAERGCYFVIYDGRTLWAPVQF